MIPIRRATRLSKHNAMHHHDNMHCTLQNARMQQSL